MARAIVSISIILAISVAGQDLSGQAAAAMRAGRFAEAEGIYRKLVAQQPKEPGWLANLGLALHSQRKYREAVESLERSLKLRPSAGLSVVLGIDYLKLGEPCKAIAPLEKTDKADALADAYYGCRRFSEAAKLYEKLGNARAAGQSWWQAREYPKARRLLESVKQQNSTDPAFCYELGDTLLRSESAQVAIPWLERAVSLVEGRAALGKAYVQVERFAEAIPHLEAALAVDPDLLLPLSRAYKATGRAAEAERALNDYKKRQAQN